MHSKQLLVPFVICFMLLGAGLLECSPVSPVSPEAGAITAAKIVVSSQEIDAKTTVHWVSIPPQSARSPEAYRLQPHRVGQSLKTLTAWVTQPKPEHTGGLLAAINGGYFDPKNQQTTSWLMQEGKLLADPTQNRHLTQNAALKPYLTKIFNRSSLKWLECQGLQRLDIALSKAPIALGCQIQHELGAGPQLLPNLTLEEEGFIGKNRDPLGANRKNARSAVALFPDGRVWLVLVQQKDVTGGMSLPILAQWLQKAGANQAIALDGGSSSALWTRETGTLIGTIDKNGVRPHRALFSVLAVWQEMSEK